MRRYFIVPPVALGYAFWRVADRDCYNMPVVEISRRVPGALFFTRLLCAILNHL